MDKIGFIGLGIMGKPMAQNLLKAGYALTFFARRPQVIQEMTAAGATSVSSPKAVAESTDIVMIIVTADPQVREVMLGPAGVLEGAFEGQLIVDMSTVSPLTTREIAGIATKKGVRVMDAPVSGGESGAKAGTLTIIAGGNREDFERCLEIFKVMGKAENIFHVGPVGIGQTVKMVNQFIGGITIAAIAEALVLGIKAGADPKEMCRVIGVSSGNSALFQARAQDYILKDYFEPGFFLDLKKKDMDIGITMAKTLNVPTPIGATAYQMFLAASGMGLGKLDFSAVCKAIETLSGVNIAASKRGHDRE
jgi:3-hydroxyisobutyrate dehydrogenase-like beta-hydroxyacid dehydrogenase